MSKIDERVVKMTFDNKDFENKVSNTRESLVGLTEKLDLTGLTASVDTIADRFSVWGIVGMNVINKLADAAVDLGKKLYNATVGQIVSGGKKRALNLEQAHFQLEGLGADVVGIMKNVDYAVDGTAYGLDEAAKVAAQFAASGMKAGDDMARSLRAVSGVAAMTGSSYEDIGNIFVKVSGNGRLMGQELLQLSGRGINAAAAIAEHMGTTEQQVRKMVTAGLISFDIFSDAMDSTFGEHSKKANETFTGSLANMKAALSRIGADFFTPFLMYSRDVFNAIRPFINDVRKAIRPFVDYIVSLMKVVSEGLVGFFGKLDASKILDYIEPIVNVFEALIAIVTKLIKPIQNAFAIVFQKNPFPGSGIQKFADWLEHFVMTEPTIKRMTDIFTALFKAIKFVKDMLSYLIIKVIAVITPFVRLIKDALIPVVAWFARLTSKFLDFNAKGKGIYKVLDLVFGGLIFLTEGIEKVIHKIVDFIKNSVVIQKAFTKLKELAIIVGDTLKLVAEKVYEAFKKIINRVGDSKEYFIAFWEVLKKIGRKIAELFGKLVDSTASFRDAIKELFKKSTEAAEKSKFVDAMQKIWEIIKAITSKIWEIIKEIGTGLKNFFGEIHFENILKTINSLSLVVIANEIRKFFGKGKDSPIGKFQEGMDKIAGILEGVGSVLQAWSMEIKSEALLKIAIAIGVLAAALLVISLINPERLSSAIAAITILFTGLMVALDTLGKMSSGKEATKNQGGLGGVLDFLGGDRETKKLTKMLTSLATAMVIMAVALKIIAGIDPASAYMALGVISVLMIVLVKSLQAIEGLKAPEKLKEIGSMLILMSVAMGIMVLSVAMLAKIDPDGLQRGILALVAIVLMIKSFIDDATVPPAGIIEMAKALLLMSAAMFVMAVVVKKFSKLSWDELARGLIGLSVSLTAMTIALRNMPDKSQVIASAEALMMVAGAMVILSIAFKIFATMGWIEMGKAVGLFAVSLVGLVLALNLMKGTEDGGKALLFASIGMVAMAVALKKLGSLSITTLVVGIGALAAVLGVFVLSAKLMKPYISTFYIMGTVINNFGKGLFFAGAGLLLITAAFVMFIAAIAGSTTKIVIAIRKIIVAIMSLIPEILAIIGEIIVGIVNLLPTFANAMIQAAISVVMTTLIGIQSALPEFLRVLGSILDKVLPWLVDYVPKIIIALVDTIISLLSGLMNRLPEMVDLGMKLVIGIIEGISRNLGAFIDALVTLIIEAVLAVANAISKSAAGIGEAVGKLIKAFVDIIVETLKALFSVASDQEVMPLIMGISVALLALAATMAIAAEVSPAGLKGAVILGEFIVIIGAFLLALGGLYQIKGVNDIIKDGGELIATIGYAIGKFIGSIIGGFGAGVTSGLPEIGTNLSLFMENLGPFIEGAKKIDSAMLDGVKEIVNVILLLTGASFLDGITSWITGSKTASLTDFGIQLAAFGGYLSEYYNKVKEIKPEILDSTSNAVNALSALAGALPSSGGSIEKILGTTSLEDFSSHLVGFGTAIVAFQASLGTGIDAPLIEAAANAGLTLAKLEGSLPAHGGILQDWLGDATLGTFGSSMVVFGQAIKLFQESLGDGINAELITAAANAGSVLAGLEDSLPKHDGLVQAWMGDADLGTFGGNIYQFGQGIKLFQEALGDGIDAKLITSAANAGKTLVSLEESLVTHGGFKGWALGDADLGTFGESLVLFGGGIKAFQSSLGKGVDSELITAAANAAKTLTELENNLPPTGGLKGAIFGDEARAFESFSTQLPFLGEGIKNFSTALGTKVNAELVESAGNAALTLAKVNEALPETGGLKGLLFGDESFALIAFAANLPELGKGIKEFSDSLGTEEIKADLITSAANAALTIAELNKALPDTGGVIQEWKGSPDLGLFAKELKPLGEGIAAFQSSLGTKIDAALITSAANAALTIASLNKELPNTGGKIEEWTGIHMQTLTEFAKELPKLGKGMMKFQTSLGGENFKGEIIESAANAALTLASLNDHLPGFAGGKIESWFGKKETLAEFGESLPGFGAALARYGQEVAELKIDKISDSVTAAEALVSISNSLEGSKGLFAFFLSDYNLKSFGTDLTSFGATLSAYGGSISDLPTVAMARVAVVIKSLVDLANNMASIKTTNPMSLFGHDLKRLGETGMSGFVSAFTDANEKIKTAVGALMINVKIAIDSHKDALRASMAIVMTAVMLIVQNASTIAYTEGQKIPTKLIEGIATKRRSVEDEGKEIIAKFLAGMDTLAETVKEKLVAPVNSALNVIVASYNDWRDAGIYVVEGFIKGIDDTISKAETAGKDLGKRTLKATEKALLEKSPSKAFYEVGAFAGQGFINALVDYTKKAENAGSDMGLASMTGAESALKQAKEILKGDLDPRIRPILDLSNVQQGSKELQSLLMGQSYSSSLAYTTSGSVKDYRTATTTMNPYSRLEEALNQMNQSGTANNYSIEVTVKGDDLSTDRIREIASTIEQEIKDVNNRLAFSRGEMVSF